jgi:transketolase
MPNETRTKKSLRDAFGEALLELGSENENVVVLSADLSDSTRAHGFELKFPQRFIQVGVAEQNMASIAAGLSTAGKIPFITSYTAFSPYGNWSQIRTSICLSKENVKIIGAHSGFSAAVYGATHLGLEDIALTRVLPNLVVLAPCDFIETKKAVKAAAQHQGPVYIRLSRDPVKILTKENTKFDIGKAQLMKTGDEVTIIGCGPILGEVLDAAEGFSCDIINCSTIKPLDEETILKSAQKTKKVITVEEHQIAGGLGGAVCESLSKWSIPVTRIGVKDLVGESGSYEDLLEKHGLTANHIKKVIESICK